MASATCNGEPALLNEWFSFTCVVPLAPGPNTITVAALDVAGNSASMELTVTYDNSFTLRLDPVMEVPAATIALIESEAQGPDGQTRTFLWTQLSGPTVTLQGANSPNLSFVSPNTDTTLTFQLSVSNGVQTLTEETEVHVQGIARALAMEAGAREGHTSTLAIASTSLYEKALFRAADTTFVVSLAAPDAATLDPFSADVPLTIYLDSADDVQDVTGWFAYDAPTQSLSLQTASVSAFKAALISENMMELTILGADSAANSVSLGVPFLYARHQVQGALTAPEGTPAGTFEQATVVLEGGDRQYRAIATPASDGTFTFDGVISDAYSVTVFAPNGLVGVGDVRFDVPSAPDVASLAIELFGPPTEETMALAGVDSGMSTTAGGAATSSLTTPGISQQMLLLPQGTKRVRLSAGVWTGGLDEAFWFWYYDHPWQHPCQIGAATGRLVIDRGFSYMFLLNGRRVGGGGGSFCGTRMEGLSGSVLDRTIDVSKATAEGDAELRVVMSNGPDITEWSVYGTAEAGAEIADAFAITGVEDTDGVGRVKRLSEVPSPWKGPTVKMMGIPHWTKATWNQWGMRIKYLPTDAEILSVKVYAQHVGGPVEELDYAYPMSTTTPGVIELTNVGFGPGSGSRPMWDAKRANSSIVVEVTAKQPNGWEITKTALLGLDINKNRMGHVLAPLYDAGEIPGALRYSLREELDGYDGWGTNDSYAFLTANPSLIFNDLSLEHGGSFKPDHGTHQQGTSIDIRYFGSSTLHQPGPRQALLANARAGNVAAQTSIVEWIRANRSGMDALFAGGGIRLIYLDPARWHYEALKEGKYDDGAQILDPADGLPIGAWSPQGRMVKAPPHLDHFHVERYSQSRGITP